MQEQKMKSLHFRVDGKGFLELVRQVYWFEDRERGRKLMESMPTVTKKQWDSLIKGDSQLIGISVCENWKNCDQCKDTKTYLQILDKPDKKFKKYLVEEGMLATMNGTVEIIIDFNGVKKVVLCPLELMLNYCHTIDNVETAITIRKYHGGLNKEFVERMDTRKLDAHERLYNGMNLKHEKCHLERNEYLESFVQEAIEKFYTEVIGDNKQPKKITVSYDDGYGVDHRFKAEVVEYFNEYSGVETE